VIDSRLKGGQRARGGGGGGGRGVGAMITLGNTGVG